MSTVAAICYACNETFLTSSRGDAVSLRCCHCGSDFVEFLTEFSETRATRQTHAHPRRSPFSERTRGGVHAQEPHMLVFPDASVSIRMAPDGTNSLMRELTQVLDMEPLHGRANRLGNFRRAFGSEMERLVGQLAQYHQPTRTPASREAVNGLRREKLMPGRRGVVGECCVVCHEHYKEGDNVVHLPCEHVFHEACVLPWFEEHNTCPVCRFALPAQSASASSFHSQHRSRRNQVAQAPTHPRDVPGDHMIDSFLDMFRPATGGDTTQRRPRERRPSPPSFHNIPQQENVTEGEGERQLRESVRSAQNQLSSLEDRLTEHVTEHRRLQNQITQLQAHRQNLREQVSAVQSQGLDNVGRMEAVVEQHHDRRHSHSPSPFGLPRWFLGMIRNGTSSSNRGGSQDIDNNITHFSDAGFGR